ncbi:MAG: 50S ribosomal protein P1, partial [Candidatus Korarchaeota archaeon]|nr:50S ribosomal protein P1 [Candidatus Korarchaeota archaeon]
ADAARVKALIASLSEVDIDEAIRSAPTLMAAQPAAPTGAPETKAKPEEKEEEKEEEKKEEEA